jgi:hypothetical protein
MSSAAAVLLALAGALPAGELLGRADEARHPLDEGVMRIHVTVETPGKPSTETDLDVYVRGGDRALCVFRSGKQEGRRVLLRGDRVWLLVPGTTHPIPVSANQRLLGGASIADVAHLRLASEFTGTTREGRESMDGVPCVAIDLVAASRKSSYRSGTLWSGIQDGLPRKLRLTLPSGKEAKEIAFDAYAEHDGRPVVERLSIRHLLPAERGMTTRLRFERYEKRSLPADLFDPASASRAEP